MDDVDRAGLDGFWNDSRDVAKEKRSILERVDSFWILFSDMIIFWLVNGYVFVVPFSWLDILCDCLYGRITLRWLFLTFAPVVITFGIEWKEMNLTYYSAALPMPY